MPINKRNISISFGQGIDSKTDPNQVMPGKLLSLQNAFLSQTMELQKRYGYQNLFRSISFSSSSITNQKLGLFNNEIDILNSSALLSFDPTTNSSIFKGNITPVEPQITQIERETDSKYNCDSAFNPSFNTTLYTWNSSGTLGAFQTQGVDNALFCTSFRVFDGNGTIILNGNIPATYRSKCFSVGNQFIITAVSPQSSGLYYWNCAANNTNPAALSSAQIGQINGWFDVLVSQYSVMHVPSFPQYDGTVLNNNLFITWFDPSSTIYSKQFNSTLTASTTLAFSNFDASISLGCFGNSQNYWVAFSGGSFASGNSLTMNRVIYTPIPFSSTANSSTGLLGSKIPASCASLIGSVQRYIGVAQNIGTSANVYEEVYSTYGSPDPTNVVSWPAGARSDVINSYSLAGSTSVSNGTIFKGLGINSRGIRFNNTDYFIGSYGAVIGGSNIANAPQNISASTSPLFSNTYFLLDGIAKQAVAKFDFENAAGYDFPTIGHADQQPPLPNLNQISNTQIQSSYLTIAIPIAQNRLFALVPDLGVNNVVFEFNSKNSNKSLFLGNNLNIAGGFLTAYDGLIVSEQNFHIFPDCLRAGLTGQGSPPIAANTYAYVATYEWIDAQGNYFVSPPSVPLIVTLNASYSLVQIDVPTIRLTTKNQPLIKLYRNAPSINPTTFFQINAAANDPTAQHVTIADVSSDANIIGNPILYTNGGVLEDTPAPSPYNMSIYRNRLMMTDSENRNIIWYSKEVLPGTPVEMTNLQELFISPRHGSVRAHIEMDDKFIIFTSDGNNGAIYYMTGQGPDATGNNNDFSEPTLITTTVSTTDQNSVILMPLGIMFRSDKGIWLLPRGLGEPDYLGAPVEAFNGNTVTSANLIPNSTRINFTLNNGVCLVYDYFQQQWSVFTNINALHGIVFQGLFTYLNANGIFQETPGLYSDNGSPILMQAQTSWLSAAGLQGYQRVYKLYLMGKYISPHLLNVSVAYDFNPNPFQTVQIRPIASQNPNWGGDPLWGATNLFGGFSQFEQNRMNLIQQKCQSIQVTIQESLDPNNVVLGAGVQLENIGLVVGPKLTYPKIPPNLSWT